MHTYPDIINILSKFLGEFKKSGDESYFKCPKCQHPKYKLEIHPVKGYHCWVCSYKGKNLVYLVREFGPQYLSEFISIYKDIKPEIKDTSGRVDIVLPDGFRRITNNTSFTASLAKKYLYSRNIDDYAIAKYNMGFSDIRPYQDHIIIPSYDSNHCLNYYIGRSIHGNGLRYLSPSIERRGIILFEEFLDFKNPIIITEGPFDAIKAWYNATPIFGSELSPDCALFIRILENKTPVIISFDNDKPGNLKFADLASKFIAYDHFDISRLIIPPQYKDLGMMNTREIIKIRYTNLTKVGYSEIINAGMNQ